MEIITGYRGEPHITSEQDQGINRSIFGMDTCVLYDGVPGSAPIPSTNGEMYPDITGANTVRISPGYASFQGCVAKCDGETLTFDNGTPYKYRQDLIVLRYTKDPATFVESVSLEIIKGSESTSTNPPRPGYAQYSIKQVPTVAPFAEDPLFAVYFEGAAISRVERVAPRMSNLSRIESMSTSISQLRNVVDHISMSPSKDHFVAGVTLPSSTSYSEITRFQVSPGMHILVASAYFPVAGTQGTRVIGLLDTPPSGGTISRDRAVTVPTIDTGAYGQVVWLYTCTTTKTIYVVARQNSGQNVEVSAAWGSFDITPVGWTP